MRIWGKFAIFTRQNLRNPLYLYIIKIVNFCQILMSSMASEGGHVKKKRFCEKSSLIVDIKNWVLDMIC